VAPPPCLPAAFSPCRRPVPALTASPIPNPAMEQALNRAGGRTAGPPRQRPGAACRADRRRAGASYVIDVLTDLFILRGIPAWIRSDNGPEFVAEVVHRWNAAVGGPHRLHRVGIALGIGPAAAFARPPRSNRTAGMSSRRPRARMPVQGLG